MNGEQQTQNRKANQRRKWRQINLSRKPELKSIAQKKTKQVQLVYKKYQNGDMNEYGWYKYENKEFIENK